MVKILDRKLFRDLIQLKSQIFTIALVICSGISVLISSFSTYQSLQVAQQQFYADYHFADLFLSLKRAPNYLADRINEIDGVAQFETRIVEDVTLDLPWQPEPATGRFISIPQNHNMKLNRLFLTAGQWLTPNSLHEVLVNEGFAKENHLKPGDSINAILNGHKETLYISGIVLSPEYVYSIRAGDLLPDNKHFGIFWINESVLSAAYNLKNAFNDISITLAPNASVKHVQTQIEQLFHQYGFITSYTRKDQISDRFVSNEIRQQGIIASFIPPIFLIVAAFLLNIVTGRLIQNQRKQIATLKAIGYPNKSIIIYYIKLMLVIISIGSLLGIILGAWLGYLMTGLYAEYFRFPQFQYHFSLSAALIGIFVSFLAVGLGTFRAVYQIIQLSPAIAMRPPTPQRYRATWLENNFMTNYLSASFKMSYRYTIRHLFRTLMTSFGIALAMAIMILGLFWNDAIRDMINKQFLMSQRENATLTFTQAVQDHVLNNIMQMPGVVDSEGYRIVPIKITNQQYTEQSSLYGMPQDSKLKRLLNDDLSMIHIIKNQIILSASLAERLHIQQGDTVYIEALEGNKNHAGLKVQQIVNDYIGMFVYAEISYVNTFMHEDKLINVANITLDPRYQTQLYSEVKELPTLSAITFKDAIINTFMDTFAKHLLVFTSILSAFAIVIAVSVVYNNAKIALSERYLELSTLRVLGFTQREILSLFFTNILFEVLLAMPMGLFLGHMLAKTILNLMQTDWFKIPFVIYHQTNAISVLVIMISSLLSLYFIQREFNQSKLTLAIKVSD